MPLHPCRYSWCRPNAGDRPARVRGTNWGRCGVPAATQFGSVEVLLATHNGETFLEAQLNSLIAQDFEAFTVIVADDCSTDSTRAIVARFAERHAGRFVVLPPMARRLGPSANFGRLLDAASADFVFFCDQDDVWLPTKMSLSLARMAEIGAGSPDAPLLVHTDLAVVDAQLRPLGASFFAYSGIDPARNSLAALLMGNVATGCTMLINRSLYTLARPVPREALMCDFWVAQVAAGLGKLSCLRKPTVLYRQHDGNVIGADRAGAAGFLLRVRRVLFSDKSLRVLTSFSCHAQVLAERYGTRLAARERRQVAVMADLWRIPRWLRFLALVRAGLRKPTLAANLGLALLVLRNGRPVMPVQGD